MTAHIHPGRVVHSMDHLVLDLATADGSMAYLTIYSLGLMPEVGTGKVALLRVLTNEGFLDRCFSDTIGLGARMQQRLRRLRSEGGSPPGVGIDHRPRLASIQRQATDQSGEHWLIQSENHTISASWSSAETPFWVSAPAPVFHPSQDYATTMISFRQAELLVDGRAIEGTPYDHAIWGRRLGRPFSSCHMALAETALEAM